MSTHDIFITLVAIHIATGTVGLISFWIPVAGRKGSASHRCFGRVFINTLFATGITAVGIATATLIAPLATHPHLTEHEVFHDPIMIRAIFGWMMLYLATLTVNLAWHGRLALRHKKAGTLLLLPLSVHTQQADYYGTFCACRGVFM